MSDQLIATLSLACKRGVQRWVDETLANSPDYEFPDPAEIGDGLATWLRLALEPDAIWPPLTEEVRAVIAAVAQELGMGR